MLRSPLQLIPANLAALSVVTFLLITLSACGAKGDLVLPENTQSAESTTATDSTATGTVTATDKDKARKTTTEAPVKE